LGLGSGLRLGGRVGVGVGVGVRGRVRGSPHAQHLAQPLQRADQRIVVVERLAHPHEDDLVRVSSQWEGWLGLGLGLVFGLVFGFGLGCGFHPHEDDITHAPMDAERGRHPLHVQHLLRTRVRVRARARVRVRVRVRLRLRVGVRVRASSGLQRTCSRISPALRSSWKPIVPVAQKVQPILHPT
jgi:hypothetical protein